MALLLYAGVFITFNSNECKWLVFALCMLTSIHILQKSTVSVPRDQWCACIYSACRITVRTGLRHSFPSIQFEAMCNTYIAVHLFVNKLRETVHAIDI
jgi:hypothetical protein